MNKAMTVGTVVAVNDTNFGKEIIIKMKSGTFDSVAKWDAGQKSKAYEAAGAVADGDLVCVEGYPESREYNGKYYTSLKIGNINVLAKGGTPF